MAQTPVERSCSSATGQVYTGEPIVTSPFREKTDQVGSDLRSLARFLTEPDMQPSTALPCFRRWTWAAVVLWLVPVRVLAAVDDDNLSVEERRALARER